MSEFGALLALQDQDIKVDQLEHKLATLPERATVEANAKAQAALADEIAGVEANREAIARDQKRLEDEVATVESHAADINDRLYNKGITSPKELQALQADLDSIKRRQSTLEDQVIELMEAAEPIDAQLATLAERRAQLIAEGEAAAAALVAAEGQTSADLDAARIDRAELAAQVEPEPLKSYEFLRPQYQGIAVARLVGTNCGGCHLMLSNMALEAIRHLPPGAVGQCEECGRILVPS